MECAKYVETTYLAKLIYISLLKLKNRSSYEMPSLNVIKTCEKSEMVFREYASVIFTKKK